jgi:uncharacterized protein
MRIATFALLTLLALRPVLANDLRPSEESVGQLFEAMHTSQILDAYLRQAVAAMQGSIRQAMEGARLNAEQQQIMDDMGAELASMFRQEINWDNLRPLMLEVYRNTFTQHEVDDMLGFYRSPTGQAVVSKLPAAMQQAMQSMQQHAKSLAPRIAQLQRETVAAMKRAEDRATTSPAESAPSPPGH